MSYCRFSKDCNVYVFMNWDGKIECNGCCLEEPHGARVFDTPQAAIEHLYEHRKAGDKVPEYAIDSIRNEIARLCA